MLVQSTLSSRRAVARPVCCLSPFLAQAAPVVLGRIPTESVISSSYVAPPSTAGFEPTFRPAPILSGRPQPSSALASAGQKSTVAVRAGEAIRDLESARQAVDTGDFNQALQLYDNIVRQYSDLALSEYARMGRALLLYQVGRVSDALIELEDASVVMHGSAEVHAALAAVLYCERPTQVNRAEQEWYEASEYDRRYTNPEWVRTTKHWPPAAISALQRFLDLK